MIKTAPDMKVRLSAELREKIEISATKNNRTMNAEIAARLEGSYRDEGRIAPATHDQEERLSAIERALISIIWDKRFNELDERLAALEVRFSPKSKGNSL